MGSVRWPPAGRSRWPPTGTELGIYRPESTSGDYPYDSLPPLDTDRCTGRFDWIAGPQVPDRTRVQLLQRISEKLEAVGLALPADFIRFHTRRPMCDRLEEVSDCFTDLSLEPIPSPAEPGAHLVRFLNDQLETVTWYMYLRPTDDSFVVQTYGLELRPDDPDWTREETGKIYWCAPTLEQFAYRFHRRIQDQPGAPLRPTARTRTPQVPRALPANLMRNTAGGGLAPRASASAQDC